MGKTVKELAGGGRPPIWLDFYDYAGGLLGGAAGIPWLDDAAFAAFHAKANSLLRPDVAMLPVERVAAALLGAQPALANAMAQKTRPTYPLRRLLEDDILRNAVAGLIAPLRAVDADRTLALAIPSPRRWLALAYEMAHGTPLDEDIVADEDEIDGAAVYLADFMRAFATSGIDTLLLCESPDAKTDLALYEPVFKTAGHYRWETGLLDPSGQAIADGVDGLDFVIAPTLAADQFGGAMLNDVFWAGEAAAVAPGQFHYGVVPAGAVPESVLQRIASLR